MMVMVMAMMLMRMMPTDDDDDDETSFYDTRCMSPTVKRVTMHDRNIRMYVRMYVLVAYSQPTARSPSPTTCISRLFCVLWVIWLLWHLWLLRLTSLSVAEQLQMCHQGLVQVVAYS